MQVQAVALKWLHHVAQATAQDQAVALKLLLAILVELHPAIADVVETRASVVCLLRFSSARAVVVPTVTQQQPATPATPVDPLQADAAPVAVHPYRHQLLLQWLHLHQW